MVTVFEKRIITKAYTNEKIPKPNFTSYRTTICSSGAE
jgi:hypothetical protein